jgi:hypothetical protein
LSRAQAHGGEFFLLRVRGKRPLQELQHGYHDGHMLAEMLIGVIGHGAPPGLIAQQNLTRHRVAIDDRYSASLGQPLPRSGRDSNICLALAQWMDPAGQSRHPESVPAFSALGWFVVASCFLARF